jgi:hypothetical protein
MEVHIATRQVPDLPELSTTPSNGDQIHIVDVSDTSESAAGTSKRVSFLNLFGNFISHLADLANPHSVTKSQVGLGNADNTSDATKNAAVATLTNKTLTSPQIGGDADLDDADGNITVQGSNPKRGLYISAAAMFAATTNGPSLSQIESSTHKVNVKTLDFDASTQEYACFVIPAPDYWDLGTITFQPIWSAASGSGAVIFGLQVVALSNDDALDTAFGTAQEVTDTLTAVGDQCTAPASSALTVGGTPAKGDQLYFRLYRKAADAGDTLAVDAQLLGLRIKFGIGQFNDA